MSARGRGRGRPSASASTSRSSSLAIASRYDSSGSEAEDGLPSVLRGQATATSKEEPEDEDAMMRDATEPSTGTSAAGVAGEASTARRSSAGATLLRRNVYTGTGKMKFIPKMVTRKSKPEETVKVEDDDEHDFSSGRPGRGRGRGRGRGDADGGAGRGRGRGELVLTASGAFALGPSAQARPVSNRGTPLGAGVMAQGPRPGSGASTSTAALVDSDPEDHDSTVSGPHAAGAADDAPIDADTGRKVQTWDLYDIAQEGEMAPLVLPRDEKKWTEEEKLRKMNEEQFGGPSGRMKREREEARRKAREAQGGDDVQMEGAEVKAKAKMDPYEEEDAMTASLQGTPSTSTASTPAPSLPSTTAHVDPIHTTHPAQASASGNAVLPETDSGLPPDEDAVVLGAEDIKITIKKEELAGYFKLPREIAAQGGEQFYLFQFPRLFPQFYDPADEAQAALYGPDAVDAEGGAADVKPGVVKKDSGTTNPATVPLSARAAALSLGAGGASSKPGGESVAQHTSESEVWRDYEAGKWQGWGKNPGTRRRDPMGGPATSLDVRETPCGRIGKIKVRRSGKVSMKLGGIHYEILPGAPTSFLQELAVLSTSGDSDALGMYIMGQLSKKFIVAPDLGKLLAMDATEKRERYLLQKRREAEEAERLVRVKQEEEERSVVEREKKAKRESTAAAKKEGAADKKAPLTGRGRGRGSAAQGTPKPAPARTAATPAAAAAAKK